MPDYDVINYGSVDAGYRQLCTKCFNTEVAESDGLDGFEHADLAPVEIMDCDGQAHLFHFRTRLFGPGVALDAFEVRDGEPAGYQFRSSIASPMGKDCGTTITPGLEPRV